MNEKLLRTYYCFPGGKHKALTMSYDDGQIYDERLVKIFNTYGIKGTFNLNYGSLDKPNRIESSKIKEIYKGHEIATHTLTHPTVARCPLNLAAQEIIEDRKGLESLAGYIVRGHAYPNGSYSEDIKQLFSKLGIAYGRVVDAQADYELPKDPMEWHPTCHHSDEKLMERARWFADFPKKQYLKLMYVWGHSYEFNNDNNWEVIEEFCRFMGGREDIWYAANIEIIDYMKAMKSLVFSMDNSCVWNPSALSVWLQINDGKIIEVKGGAMMDLS